MFFVFSSFPNCQCSYKPERLPGVSYYDTAEAPTGVAKVQANYAISILDLIGPLLSLGAPTLCNHDPSGKLGREGHLWRSYCATSCSTAFPVTVFSSFQYDWISLGFSCWTWITCYPLNGSTKNVYCLDITATNPKYQMWKNEFFIFDL